MGAHEAGQSSMRRDLWEGETEGPGGHCLAFTWRMTGP